MFRTMRNRDAAPKSPKSVITVRLDPNLHDRLMAAANARGQSLNLLCVEALEKTITPIPTE